MDLYIVQSGEGYFTGFSRGGTPSMTSDPVVAIRFPKDGALDVIARLGEKGWEAWEVKLRFARISVDERWRNTFGDEE